MKIVADRSICMGAGSCKQLAPLVFEQNEMDGLVILLSEQPDAAQDAAVRQAVLCCPSGAIQISDE